MGPILTLSSSIAVETWLGYHIFLLLDSTQQGVLLPITPTLEVEVLKRSPVLTLQTVSGTTWSTR